MAQHDTSAYHILLVFGNNLKQGLLCNISIFDSKASLIPVSGTVHNENKSWCLFLTVAASYGKGATRATKEV